MSTLQFIRRCWPILLVFALGCGDTYVDLVSEEAALANELADSLLKVTDEASAAHVKQYRADKIKNKLKDLKDRKDRFDKNNNISALSQVSSIAKSKLTQQGFIKGGDYVLTYTPPPEDSPKDPVKLEIMCNTASIYADIKMLMYPETQENIKSITRRIDQQLARINSIVSRLRAERPGSEGEWTALASYKNVMQDVFPAGVVNIPVVSADIPIKLKDGDPEKDTLNLISGIIYLIISGGIIAGLLIADFRWKPKDEEAEKSKNKKLGGLFLFFGIPRAIYPIYGFTNGEPPMWMAIGLVVGGIMVACGIVFLKRNSED